MSNADMSTRMQKGISIVIPVFNEAQLIETDLTSFLDWLLQGGLKHEVVIVENGSKDASYKLLKKLRHTYHKVSLYKLSSPSYARALLFGIEKAQYDSIFQLDMDLLDRKFIKDALIKRQTYDVVVGSKLHKQSQDKRSIMRICISKIINWIIRAVFHYPGTDTHGLKAFSRSKIRPFLDRDASMNHFFDTTMLLRAHHNGLRIKEIPISIRTLRSARFPMHVRLTEVCVELLRLFMQRSQLLTRSSRLTFSSDDFGLNKETTKRTLRLSHLKAISAVNCMANFPHHNHIPKLHKKMEIGVHINLTEGYPILPKESVSSLVSASGMFYSLPIFYIRLLLHLVNTTQIENEILAQISSIKKYGRRISELNSHQHIHAFSPIDSMFLKVARIKKIPRLRSYNNIIVSSLRARVFMFALIILRYISHLSWQSQSTLRTLWNSRPIAFMSWETGRYFSAPTNPPSDTIEVVIHPGTPFDHNTFYEQRFRSISHPSA